MYGVSSIISSSTTYRYNFIIQYPPQSQSNPIANITIHPDPTSTPSLPAAFSFCFATAVSIPRELAVAVAEQLSFPQA
jgi:hypothetical protein